MNNSYKKEQTDGEYHINNTITFRANIVFMGISKLEESRNGVTVYSMVWVKAHGCSCNFIYPGVNDLCALREGEGGGYNPDIRSSTEARTWFWCTSQKIRDRQES